MLDIQFQVVTNYKGCFGLPNEQYLYGKQGGYNNTKCAEYCSMFYYNYTATMKS